jgi:hypothetical protein
VAVLAASGSIEIHAHWHDSSFVLSMAILPRVFNVMAGTVHIGDGGAGSADRYGQLDVASPAFT